MAAPPPHVVERLGYIRFLHQEGVRQATRPHPLSSAAVLSFHDAVELFYVLALDVKQVPADPRMPFDKYWLALSKVVPNLSLGRASERLNRVRVGLKHHGMIPSQQQVIDARTDTDAFLAANTPAVFGLDYDSVSTADIVPQAAVRAKVRAAEAANADGERNEAMGFLAESFHQLFHPRAHGETEIAPLAFGPDLGWPYSHRHGQTESLLVSMRNDAKSGGYRDVRPLAGKIDRSAEIAALAQSALRVMTLGIEYPRYLRFQQLVPGVSLMLDGRVVRGYPEGYAPSDDHFQYCIQFVVEVALRIAEVAAELEPPPWRTR
jgi:hypothetical protein